MDLRYHPTLAANDGPIPATITAATSVAKSHGEKKISDEFTHASTTGRNGRVSPQTDLYDRSQRHDPGTSDGGRSLLV